MDIEAERVVASMWRKRIPAYDELIYVPTPPKWTRTGQKFIKATELATQFIINNPSESWSIFSGTAKELQNELNKRAWRDTLPRFAMRPAAFDHGRYMDFQAFLESSGLIAKTVPITSIAIDVTAK